MHAHLKRAVRVRKNGHSEDWRPQGQWGRSSKCISINGKSGKSLSAFPRTNIPNYGTPIMLRFSHGHVNMEPFFQPRKKQRPDKVNGRFAIYTV